MTITTAEMKMIMAGVLKMVDATVDAKVMRLEDAMEHLIATANEAGSTSRVAIKMSRDTRAVLDKVGKAILQDQ